MFLALTKSHDRFGGRDHAPTGRRIGFSRNAARFLLEPERPGTSFWLQQTSSRSAPDAMPDGTPSTGNASHPEVRTTRSSNPVDHDEDAPYCGPQGAVHNACRS